MRRLPVLAGAIRAALIFTSSVFAQQPAAPPAPPSYGPPVTIAQAKKAVAAALACGPESPYLYVFAVVDPTGSLVYFERMDGAIYASNEIAIRKAAHCCDVQAPHLRLLPGDGTWSFILSYIDAGPDGLCWRSSACGRRQDHWRYRGQRLAVRSNRPLAGTGWRRRSQITSVLDRASPEFSFWRIPADRRAQKSLRPLGPHVALHRSRGEK